MLTIKIKTKEFYDEEVEEFVILREQTLQLEHSLVSISKWEAKWCKPFLSKKEKTTKETLDYIRCMTINNVDDRAYTFISNDQIKQIMEYIESPQTATTFSNTGDKKTNNKIITSERIYYWMVAHNIPFECQKWHLNRLLTLINVCNIENTPPKKMNKKEIMSRNAALNAERRKAFGGGG